MTLSIVPGQFGPGNFPRSWDAVVSGKSPSVSAWPSYWYGHVTDSASPLVTDTPLSGLTLRLQLAGSHGNRNAIQGYISVDQAPNAADASLQNYVSVSSLGYSNAAAKTGLVGGANFSGYAGSLWGNNPNVWAAPGAVHWLGLYGAEFDTSIQAGADVAERYGAFIVSSGATLGAIDDAGLAFSGTNGNGMQFGGVRHTWSVTGAFIAAVARTQGGSSTPSAAYGIDFTAAAFTAAPIAAPLMTPASSSAAGKAGAMVWDANFIYVCTAANTWKRAALTTF